MRQSISRFLKFIFVAVIALTVGACEKKSYPGAPEGYNYQTLQVTWKWEGATTGTQEIYVETSGYENGGLVFERYAMVTKTRSPIGSNPDKTDSQEQWYFIKDGKLHNILESVNLVGVTPSEIYPYVRAHRVTAWQEIIGHLSLRKDLTLDQRRALPDKPLTISDDDLLPLGAKISEVEFMGQKVKYYDIPLNDGKAELWLYGDIPLKLTIDSKWGDKPVKKSLEATKVVVNRRLPKKPFTIPSGMKVFHKPEPSPNQ